VVRTRHLYVHVPFCSRRCTYCDFSIAVRKQTPIDDFVEGLHLELTELARESHAGDIGQRWILHTLYLGGGTPSRLGGPGVARALEAIAHFAELAPDAEVTLEANPEDVTLQAAEEWRRSGVNRLSIGAQSFDDVVLRWMHRVHDAKAIHSAVRAAREAGFDNVSLDLIFALPESVNRSWSRDLDEALSLNPQHISLYGLTVEPASPLGRVSARGGVGPQSDERYALEFLEAHDRATRAGFEHYEVSNFAMPDFRSRHNSAYWTGAPYTGIGPAAHSYDGSSRRWNVAAYVDWLKRLRAGRPIIAGSEHLTKEQHASEAVYLGLRTVNGYRVSESDRPVITQWQSAGWATLEESTLRLNAEGWLRLDALASGLTVS
jgi:oxygen-independent coproporphyrinogen-3 oxidase